MEELKNEQKPKKKAPLSEEQMEEAAPSFLGWPQASKKKKHKKRKENDGFEKNSQQRIQSPPYRRDKKINRTDRDPKPDLYG